MPAQVAQKVHLMPTSASRHLIRASLPYTINYRDRKTVASALRMIYAATNADEALIEPERIEGEWGTATPAPAPFLALPNELRIAVYTTITIERMRRQIRHAIKTAGTPPSRPQRSSTHDSLLHHATGRDPGGRRYAEIRTKNLGVKPACS